MYRLSSVMCLSLVVSFIFGDVSFIFGDVFIFGGIVYFR